MNPFTCILPAHVTRFLATFFSHKSLSDLAQVSKSMSTLAFDEAVRRYYGTVAAYETAKKESAEIDSLTSQGAHFFLARPHIGRLKLACATKSRDIDLILLAIRSGADDYTKGCIRAAKQGDYDIAIFLFEKSKGNKVSKCLSAAYQGGNRDLINYFSMLRCPPNWNKAMNGACKSGRTDLVDKLFSRYTGSREALIFMARRDLAMVRYLVEKKKVSILHHCSITIAMVDGHPDTANYLLDTFPLIDTCPIFVAACERGLKEFAQRLLPDSVHDIHRGFRKACKHGRADIMSFLAEEIEVDWDSALVDVCMLRVYNLMTVAPAMKLCIDRGATNLGPIREILTEEGMTKFMGWHGRQSAPAGRPSGGCRMEGENESGRDE
jgi:hypothetical protein